MITLTRKWVNPTKGEIDMLDAKKLKGKIVEAGMTQGELAKIIGISQNTLTRKLTGRRDFTVGEIDRICDALHITDNGQKSQIFLR